MKKTYAISGMTCGNCVAHVHKALIASDSIDDVEVDLENSSATITSSHSLLIEELQESLPNKYTISEYSTTSVVKKDVASVSKITQLRPLFLILFYIGSTSVLLHYSDWSLSAAMTDFMGLFFIVFSFFKMLDITGFASSFAMYDPLASRIKAYGLIYPFIETGLGLMLLLRWQVDIALVLTVVVLGITTVGVIKTLLSKKTIKCACLGTTLNLPMTEATFIENTVMIVMAIAMFAI